jgi:ribosomal protein S18 acetylase RimI-like enzyme
MTHRNINMNYVQLQNNPKDLFKLIKFIEAINGNFSPSILSIVSSINDYAAKLLDNAYVLAAIEQGNVVGVVGIYANDTANKVGFISIIGVIKIKQRCGIGQCLMNKASQYACNNGMRVLRLEVQSKNYTAIKFYELSGYVRVADNYKNGVNMIVMERKLFAKIN